MQLRNTVHRLLGEVPAGVFKPVEPLPVCSVSQAEVGTEIDDLRTRFDKLGRKSHGNAGWRCHEDGVASRNLVRWDPRDICTHEVSMKVLQGFAGAGRCPRDLNLWMLQQDAERLATHVARGAKDAYSDHSSIIRPTALEMQARAPGGEPLAFTFYIVILYIATRKETRRDQSLHDRPPLAHLPR